jgi:hypothetical protein
VSPGARRPRGLRAGPGAAPAFAASHRVAVKEALLAGATRPRRPVWPSHAGVVVPRGRRRSDLPGARRPVTAAPAGAVPWPVPASAARAALHRDKPRFLAPTGSHRIDPALRGGRGWRGI